MSKFKKLKIGTRSSALAMWQTNYFIKRLGDVESFFRDERNIEIIPIKTTGDRVLDKPLRDIGGKALFAKEIEVALLSNQIDVGVHSMKDMETDLPENLTIACMLKREDPRDVFLSHKYTLGDLPQDAKVGTVSLRRMVQLKKMFPNVSILPLRGNIVSRLEKLKNGEFDAIILALAGLKRLNLVDDSCQPFSFQQMLPAVGQGVVGVECRKDDVDLIALLERVSCLESRMCVEIERSMLKTLGGSCHTPIAGFCEKLDDSYVLEGLLANPETLQMERVRKKVSMKDACSLGENVARDLMKKMDVFRG